MLSDYRVIVLGVSQASVTPGLRRRLEGLDTSTSPKKAPTTNDMTRVLGVSLAVNGVTKGTVLEQPGKLPPHDGVREHHPALEVVCGGSHGPGGSARYD